MIHPGRKASWHKPVADSPASPEQLTQTGSETLGAPQGREARYWDRARHGAAAPIVTTEDDLLREVEERRQSLRPQSLLGTRSERPPVIGTPHGGKPE